MIKVKAAKTPDAAADETDPYAPRQKPARQGLPFVIGTAIVAVALYLKSMVSASAQPSHPGSQGDHGPGSGQRPLSPSVTDSDTATAAPATAAAASNAEPPPSSGKSAQQGSDTAIVPALAPASGNNVVALFPMGQSQKAFVARHDPQPDAQNKAAPRNSEAPSSRKLDDRPQATGSSSVPLRPAVATEHGAQAPATGSSAQTSSAPQRNRAPVISRSAGLADLLAGEATVISLAGLLAFATDADGGALRVENLTASSGQLQPTTGGFLFTPDSEATGPVQISYTITDGEFSLAQTAHFAVLPRPLDGSETADHLTGTTHADVIVGKGGDDDIDAGSGNDVVYGDDGNDLIIGGTGNDLLFGGLGADSVFGEGGNDVLHGNDGNDRLYGGDGQDVLSGDTGDDMVDGGAESDLLFGGDGADSLAGGAGDDVLLGDAGDDLLDGNAGNDALRGGAGNDVLTDSIGADSLQGDAGCDVVIAALDAADDRFNGDGDAVAEENGVDAVLLLMPDNPVLDGQAIVLHFDEVDILDYSAAGQTLEINLDAGTVQGVEVGTDIFEDFEVVIGGQGDDNFIIGDGQFILSGGDGDDRFDFSITQASANVVISAFQILDFSPGDVVETRQYRLFDRDGPDTPPGLGDDDVPGNGVQTLSHVRIRYEAGEDHDNTVVELDDDDNQLAAIVTINGHHVMVFAEMT